LKPPLFENINFIPTFKALKTKSLIEPFHIPRKKEYHREETGALAGAFVCRPFSPGKKFLGRESPTYTRMHIHASKENFSKNKNLPGDLFLNSG